MNLCLNCQTPIRQKYCSALCQTEFQYKQFIERWLAGKEKGTKGWNQVSGHIKRWLFAQRGAACWQCGWNEINPLDNKCPLEVDHIDGTHDNNRPENLRLLCPNCHALTPTYKNRNKGNGRSQRRDLYHSGKTH